MDDLTKEQFEYWYNMPETKIIKAFLEERLKDYEGLLLCGGTIDHTSTSATAMRTAEMLGVIKGISMFTGLSYE
jgi:hypothetical protein